MSLVGLSLLGLLWWRREGFWKVVLMETAIGAQKRGVQLCLCCFKGKLRVLESTELFPELPLTEFVISSVWSVPHSYLKKVFQYFCGERLSGGAFDCRLCGCWI